MIDPQLIERLTSLLGRECRHQGQPYRLVDLLPAEGLLVLESAEARPAIQLDQFGRPSYRAPDLHPIPILTADGTGMSQELEHLILQLTPPSPA